MDKDNWLEIISLVGEVFLVVIILFGPAAAIAIAVDAKSCKSAYENYQPEYGILSGCRIMHDGKLTPVKMVKILQ